MANNSVNIIGAGQCGTLMAIMLARHGFHVDVYERFKDPRVQDAEAGRSINLALAARGLNALQQIGIDTNRIHSMGLSAGGLHTTVDDMHQWLSTVRGQGVLDAETSRRWTTG